MMMWLALALVPIAAASSVSNLIVGLHLSGDGKDVELANVFDGSFSNPVQRAFDSGSCGCSRSACELNSCGTECHMETKQVESRFYYAQNTDPSKTIRLRDPKITSTPLCHTDTNYIDLETSALALPPSETTLRPDGIARVELDFVCKTKNSGKLEVGLFDVQVSMEVKSPSMENYENVTWHFRKLCVTEYAAAQGITIKWNDKTVVQGGEAQDYFHPNSANTFDVGYDRKDKKVDFMVSYRASDSSGGTIKYDMIEPDFDQTVVKSVAYKGAKFSSTSHNSLVSGSKPTNMGVRVTCQPHPKNLDAPGDIKVGLTNIVNANGQLLKPVEFKFQVECANNDDKISPFGVLLIVFLAYMVICCIGGYFYNTHYTNRRGVEALPMIEALRSVVRRPKYYPIVNEGDEDDGMLEEEILSGLSSENNAYGAI